MKYIIESNDVIGYTPKYAMLFGDGYMIQPLEDLEELNFNYINEHFGDLQDEAYQRGLDDAWEAAKMIADMWTRIDNDELLAIFGITERIGHSTIRSLFEKQTANEAMLELEAYEEKQKADDEIKVGDEVAFHHDDRPDTVVVVTYIGQDGFIDGMDGRGTQYAHKNPAKWTKTGRHFDIDKILKEMSNHD